MSRGWWIIALVMLMIVVIGTQGSLHAQTGVQIARPLDGATVRETVRVIVPASSVPSGGYVAVMIDGKRRGALAKDVEADAFIYEWDTKGLDPDNKLPLAQRQPREGAHTIGVQAYDSAGKLYGEIKQVEVTVKNRATELMPASGLLLRFDRKIGAQSKYRFTHTTNIRDIGGARELADTLGQAIEFIEYVVAQSTEDIRPDGTALIRQKGTGPMKLGVGGAQIAGNIGPTDCKAAYRIEDGCGRTVGSIESLASGEKLVIEIPNLPVQRVRIGDSWSDLDNVFQDWTSGSNMAMTCNSTLEGLEWQGGYPCAKIKTTFTGTKKLPNSPILKDAVPIKGERITYFAFQVGKVISCHTTLTITSQMDRSSISGLQNTLMSTYKSKIPSMVAAPRQDSGGGFDMQSPGFPNESGGMFDTGSRDAYSSSSSSANTTFEIVQKVELVH